MPSRPRIALDVELVGEMPETGFVDRQWLIKRGGQFIQLTELLYRIAEAADGAHTLEEIAEQVTDRSEWMVTAEDVRTLTRTHLLPLDLIHEPGRAAPDAAAVRKRTAARSPLAVNMRMKAIGPRAIEPVTSVLQYLFAPPVLVPMLAIVAAAHLWLYRERGLLNAFIDALYTPGFIVIVLALMLAAGVFHEFGHASALRYGGGRVRGMGAGFYLLFPAFYTDVTDSYRLGRWARVRTGLGGVYFHLVFAVGLIALAVATGWEFLLVAVLLISIEAVRQFIPFVRLDGYWVLTDLTGIPDFFSQTGPFLRSVFPGLRGLEGPRLPPLRPWVKAVFAVYLVLALPAMLFLLYLIVRGLPRLATLLWDALATQAHALADGWADDDLLGLATAASQAVVLALTSLGIAYLLYALGWKPLLGAFRQPTPRRRLVALLAVAAALAAVAVLWAPNLPFARSAPPAGVATFDVTSRLHVGTEVSYPQSPPIGGDHAPVWQTCGVYSRPVRDENAVHSLEHGAVWIAYRPGLDAAQVDRLRRLGERHDYVLVAPYRGLGDAVVASAWGRQLRLDSPRDARLERFVTAFRLASSAPERGAPCSGGLGTPE